MSQRSDYISSHRPTFDTMDLRQAGHPVTAFRSVPVKWSCGNRQAFRDQQVPALEKDTSFLQIGRWTSWCPQWAHRRRKGVVTVNCLYSYISIYIIYIYRSICVYGSFSIHAPCLLSSDCLVEEMDLLWQRYAPNFGAGVSWEHFQKQLRQNLRHLH